MTSQPLQAARTCPYAPPAQHGEMRDNGGITRVRLPNGREARALSRVDHLRAMLSDPRLSSDRDNPRCPSFRAGGVSPSAGGGGRILINMDPPEHGPARRAITGEFTLRRVAELRPRIQEIVDEQIDAMLAGPQP